MSRLVRYKDSLDHFIKHRSCLFNIESIPNANIDLLLYKKIKENDMLLAILLLTIMNSQLKKKRISVQGYRAAASMEFLNLMSIIIDNRKKFIEDYGELNYRKLTNHLLICSIKSICDNLDSIKNSICSDSSIKIFIEVMNILNDKISCDNLFYEYIFKFNNVTPKNDTLKWYLKDNTKVKNEFLKINQINKESFINYIDKKTGNLCEMAFKIGWLLGYGDINQLSSLKPISKYFSIIYKLYLDFQNVENDIINNNNGISMNYVVNYGLQESYEFFMENKQKFLEQAMTLDIYSGTIKEILNYIENKVDEIIDQTSPDLKSNFSSIQENVN